MLGLKIDDGEMFERLLCEETMPIAEGDLFVFFTDGITEAMDASDDCFGEVRLEQAHRGARHLPTEELRERVLREIAAFVGDAPQHDDMTMILLRVGQPAHGTTPVDRGRRGGGALMSDLVTIFRTQSDVEASIVRGLLEANGVFSIVSSPVTHSVFPLTVNELGEVRIAVHPEEAEEARRIIDSHRTELTSGQLVRLRDEFDALQRAIDYRFRDRGPARARDDAHLARERGRERRRHRQRVARVSRRRRARIRRSPTCCSASFPASDEGQKSKIKASLVSTTTLARQAERLALGDHLLLGRGEEKTGGRQKQALLADAYEALIAAIYLDGGIEHARAFIAREFAPLLAEVRAGGLVGQDYKSALQEYLQSHDQPLPEYRLAGTVGPDHRKLFQVDVVVEARRSRRAGSEQEGGGAGGGAAGARSASPMNWVIG